MFLARHVGLSIMTTLLSTISYLWAMCPVAVMLVIQTA